jgi:O-6-methylguanine DNA methyltransferase
MMRGNRDPRDAGRAVVRTALGEFMVEATGRGLCSVTPVRAGAGGGAEAAGSREAGRHARAGAEFLVRYVEGEGARYDGALDLAADDLRLAVWEHVRAIPFGATASYGDIAAALGMPDEARAIGAAVAANPLCVVVPCHRVVGADGSLRGFAWGLDLKRRLLAHEGSVALSLFG